MLDSLILRLPRDQECVIMMNLFSGNALPPLAILANAKSTPDLVQPDKDKELRKELKTVDEEDKALDFNRQKENRIKDKVRWKRGKGEEDEADIGSEEDISASREENRDNRVHKKARIYFDSDTDDGESMRDKKGVAADSISLAEQEELALKLLTVVSDWKISSNYSFLRLIGLLCGERNDDQNPPLNAQPDHQQQQQAEEEAAIQQPNVDVAADDSDNPINYEDDQEHHQDDAALPFSKRKSSRILQLTEYDDQNPPLNAQPDHQQPQQEEEEAAIQQQNVAAADDDSDNPLILMIIPLMIMMIKNTIKMMQHYLSVNE
ncbi:hypothetical protein ACH5RR_037953 [Cinchona calisaya]|uniref:Uncharacterized protein n=1 Tax=Cinchona calisaya TaxID=153742 RepID=A0ABD2Y7N0_9GENT